MSPPSDSPRADLDGTIAGCTAAHRSLMATVDGVTDADARRPSLLPGWSVGHVLTHLARNADSHVRILEGAARGEVLEQYAGGYDQRAADIEAGAGRPAAALVDDVRASTARLEAAWSDMTDAGWDGHGRSGGRVWPCRELPFFRWREVEIHHADLGLAYGVLDWSEAYVARELPRVLASVPARLDDPADRRRVLAWLVGRADGPGGVSLRSF